MPSYRPNDSRAVLLAKSRIAQRMQTAPKPAGVLIIDDQEIEMDRLSARLRGVFGFETMIRAARTLRAALTATEKQQPGLIFLDDNLKPLNTATTSIPSLRKAGATCPIIVISAQVERRRSAALVELGALDVVDRDHLTGARIAEAWLRHWKLWDEPGA